MHHTQPAVLPTTASSVRPNRRPLRDHARRHTSQYGSGPRGVVNDSTAINLHVTKVLPGLTDPSKKILEGTSVVEEEVVGAIKDRRRFLRDYLVDKENRGAARWCFHPSLPMSVVNLPTTIGFSVMVHASHFAAFVGFRVDVALDSDSLGLNEQVCVDLLTNFEGELLKAASIGHVAS
jgi:hypothetical protein